MRKGFVRCYAIVIAAVALMFNKVPANAMDVSNKVVLQENVITPKGVVKPAAITGLKIDKDDYTLHWNAVSGTYCYEIAAYGSDGKWYYDGGNSSSPQWLEIKDPNQVTEVSTENTVAQILAKLCILDGSGKTSIMPKAGETYTICVRAVNAGIGADGKVNAKVNGDYATISYKMPSYNYKKTENITHFSYQGFDKENDRFTFSIPEVDPYTEMSLQLSLYSNLSKGAIKRLKYDPVSGLYYVNRDTLAMFDGKVLYFRVYCPVNKSKTGSYYYSNSTPVQVRDDANKLLGTITNLAITERQEEGRLVFTYTDKVEEGSKVKLIYSKSASFSDAKNADLIDGTYSVKLSALDENVKYYFKANVTRELTKFLWSDGTETKDAFTTRAKAALGVSDVTVYTPFSGVTLYYVKYSEINAAGIDSNVVNYTKVTKCTDIAKFGLENVGGNVKVLFNNTALKADEKIQVCWSTKSDFKAGKDSYGEPYTKSKIFDHKSSASGEVYLTLAPVKTYIKARIVKSENGYKSGADTQESYFYGKWSKVENIKPEIMPATISFHDKSTKSVTVFVGTKGGVSSGVEIGRYNGSSYKTIYTGTDPYYTFSKLTSNKEYKFRARRYYYDTATKKKIYSPWVEASLVTWGTDFNVKAKANSADSVTITWDKVAGASEYQVFRAKAEYNSATGNSKYYSYELLTTLSPSVKTFTDKKLSSYTNYSYVVKAKRKIGSKTYLVQGQDDVYTGFDKIDTSTYIMKDGKVALCWKPVVGATNYYVEKYNFTTSSWAKYKTLGKSSYKTALPICKSVRKNAAYDLYRVRAGKSGGTYSSYSSNVYVYPRLDAPKKVKAVASSNGSVTVTWDKVEGADYYMVYKTQSAYKSYDSEKEGYTYTNVKKVNPYVKDSKSSSGYALLSDEKMTSCKLTDSRIVAKDSFGYESVLNEGPAAGKSYYYVVACRKINSEASYDEKSSVYVSAGSDCDTVYVYDTSVKPQLTVTASKKKNVISWKKLKNVSCVEIYKASGNSNKFKKIKSINSSKTTSYEDTDVVKGTKYSYKIRAGFMDKNGELVYTQYTAVKSVTGK